MENLSYFPSAGPNLRLVGRRTAEAIVDFVAWYGEAAVTRGRSLWQSAGYPSNAPYERAKARLIRRGVLAYRRHGTNEPVLDVLPSGRRDEFQPERFWRQTWAGHWFVLVYDIPEAQRRFRDTLRHLLARLRMGQLQKSVWISPRDIRPEYEDLKETVGVHFVAHLLQARELLGQGPRELARRAWDFDGIRERQAWYLAGCERNLKRLRSDAMPKDQAAALASEEITAYLTAMQGDPLLPRKLLPESYLGADAFEAHREFVRAAARRL